MAAPFSWSVSPEEWTASAQQFSALGPSSIGTIGGETARNFFLKSNLPPPTLGAIWGMADLNKDGQLDVKEFVIAMKLIRATLAGTPLPPALPPQLLVLQPPQPVGVAAPVGVVPMGYGAPAMAAMAPPTSYAPPPPIPAAYGAPVQAPLSVATRQLGNWTIPQPTKLKYSQQFNQIDKNRVGFLTGVHARNVMAQSGLPTPALAHIWTLADVNKDGRLSVDEFCIAMHLIEQHKAGYALPPTLPPELAEISAAARGAMNASPVGVTTPGEAPPQKSPAPKTFEDKRKENYDRGQADLDRRRAILKEEEDRRREEQERREREEFERKERERIELEKRRERERREEMERLRILEEARREEERRREAEKEAARKEMEKQRQAELDKIRIRDLEAQKQQEVERTAQKQQKQKSLTFQLQALDETAKELNEGITKARDDVVRITKEIEGMKGQRDEKLRRIAELQQKSQQLTIETEHAAHVLLQLQGASRGSADRAAALEEARRKEKETASSIEAKKAELETAKERTLAQKALLEEKRAAWEAVNNPLKESYSAYEALYKKLQQLQRQAHEKLAQKQRNAAQAAAEAQRAAYEQQRQAQATKQAAQSQAASTHTGTAAQPNNLPTASTGGTVKYRALYEFVARSDDELSFQPGDIILVFEGHAAEPGWLAGQIRDKVGWFPRDFAESLAPVKPSVSSPMQSVPPNVTPSPSLERILEEPTKDETVPATTSAPASVVAVKGPEKVLGIATATFPGKARNPGDLTFNKGDRIEVLEQQEMRWKGRLADGTTGWFLKSYVKFEKQATEEEVEGAAEDEGNQAVAEGSETPKAQPATPPASPTEEPAKEAPEETSVITPTSQQASEAATVSDEAPEQANGHTIPTAAAANSVPTSASVHSIKSNHSQGAATEGEWYEAMFDFTAQEATDLALKAGEKVLVLEKKSDWWKGRKATGEEGIFPANYVQPANHGAQEWGVVVAAFEGTAPNQLSLRVGDHVLVRARGDAGWWEGELMRDGVPVAGWFPANYIQIPSPVASGSSQNLAGAALAPGQFLADALYDYDAQRDDELSFKAGEVIVIEEKTDDSWWTGHRQSAPSNRGLFPANYVQARPTLTNKRGATVITPTTSAIGSPGVRASRAPAIYDVVREEDMPPPQVIYDAVPIEAVPANAPLGGKTKLELLAEELRVSEMKYEAELSMVHRLFAKNLQKSHVLSEADHNKVFLNWQQLIKVSRTIISDLQHTAPGATFVKRIDDLHAFVDFCSRQQSALEFIGEMLGSAEYAKFAEVYEQCRRHEVARGLSLNHFLLLPLGRVTRYPLIFENMLKHCAPTHPDYQNLENSHQLLKALVAEVNHVISHAENMQMMLWSQLHVKCDNIHPMLEFAAPTRFMGSRTFLHSGVLYKARSGRLLVALLYNDFLLLTVPVESIDEPEGFRITKSSETHLVLYKMPFLLNRLHVSAGKDDDTSLTLKIKDEDNLVALRALNRNVRQMWLNQLEKAIDICTVCESQALPRKQSFVNDASGAKGRLLVEIVAVHNLDPKLVHDKQILIHVAVGNDLQVFPVQDATKIELKLTTQFPIKRDDENFMVSLLLPRLYSPDVRLEDEAYIPIRDLIAQSSTHRGPILMQVPLVRSRRTLPKTPKETVVLKFVVQLFETL